MNLPAHIITCSPPSMNLSAHGTSSPDPSITSPLKNNAHKSQLQRYCLAQPKPRQAKPAQTAWQDIFAARRQIRSEPLFEGLPPSKPHLAARRHAI
ncbi:hypothetical protein DEO72_LG11g1451 [Vigna unguiculata]|uniref:Uncharacterized protein n=1 Tax=Vigna unguiculata TaxID=3917 RepID=A0A4D6NND3_VIGUN|nr:hypothetical protein DEO72_LG11g1451 [Vigna unguiculata]